MTTPSNLERIMGEVSAGTAEESAWIGKLGLPASAWQHILATAPLAAWIVDLQGRFVWAAGQGLERWASARTTLKAFDLRSLAAVA